MSKFNRKYQINITLESGEILIIKPPLTIVFNINRSTMASLNSMNLQILNLSATTRKQIFQDRFNPRSYKRIELMAGYDSYLTTIFRGNIFQANSTRSGTEIITTIDARDGGFDTGGTLTNYTLEAGSKEYAIKKLIGEFSNLKSGNLTGIEGSFRRPVVLNGNTFDLIKKYSDNKVFIDMETVNILGDDQAFSDFEFIINSDSGLLGTPQRNDSFLTVNSMFEPRITMGQLVKIESTIEKSFNGEYKVIGLKHSGTISEAISGNLTSSFNLLVGSQLFGGFKSV